MTYKYTSEELLSQSETLEILNGLGLGIDGLCKWIKDFHSDSSKYKENIYYHVTVIGKGGSGSGVGDGLYLGKDVDALINFYGVDYKDYEGIITQTYYGNPNFLDLTNHDEFDKYKIHAKKKFPNEFNKNELKKMTLKLGYDGIRYYDPLATGEEFVLYNIDKIRLIKE